MISAVVLAAGMSTRMGQNKLLLEYKNQPLIVRAVDTLLASEVGEVIVVLGYEVEKIEEQLRKKPVRLVLNPDYRDGQSTSVRMGIQAVTPETEAIMICLGDQPLLEPHDINSITRAFYRAQQVNKRIVVPFFEGERGNPVVLDSALRGEVQGVVGDVGCRGVIKRYPEKVFVIEMDTDHVTRDVDTLEDFREVVAASSGSP